MTETLTHPESQQEMPVPDGHVGIPIDGQLAHLALMAADGFKKLSRVEILKLQSMLQVRLKNRAPSAKSVADMCRLIGFTFAMKLDETREQRIQEKKEQANASDDTGAS